MSELTKEEKKKKVDISYKYMPVSIFDVQKMGKKELEEKEIGEKRNQYHQVEHHIVHFHQT